MLIGGFQKFSMIDYPGKTCAIVFAQGCNFRCAYCHNRSLLDRRFCQKRIAEGEINAFLEKRRGILEGVTVTGGEPLLQENIFSFLESLKRKKYSVKLDTNGSLPERLERVVRSNLVDYIAMDVKAPLAKYSFVAGADVDTENIKRSIDVIMRSGLDYQFRTTVGKSFLNLEDLRQICGLIRGARNYVIQKFVPPSAPEPERTARTMDEYGDEEIRRYQDDVVNFL